MKTADDLMAVESQIESELVPTSSYVSVLGTFFHRQKPQAVEDAEYMIQRTYMSRNELLDLSAEDGFLPSVINECLEKDIGVHRTQALIADIQSRMMNIMAMMLRNLRYWNSGES